MRNSVASPIANIPVAPKSHTRGWAAMWARQLDAEINHKMTGEVLKSDYLFIDHGVNFGGTLNLFGGANEDVYNRVHTMIQHSDIVSLDIPMPDYGSMLKQRIGASTTFDKITPEWCDHVSSVLAKCDYVDQAKMCYGNLHNVVIGDSHATAFAGTADQVFRNNGKTLFGVLNYGLSSELRGIDIRGRNIAFQFGSIDIRHHILRNKADVESMVTEYVNAAKQLDCQVHFCAPVPIEYEGRRIPKTGFYKGTPFYGTADERREVLNRFIGKLLDLAPDNVICPPIDWYTMDPQEYAEKHMELSSSVHIAPIYYRSNNWGVTE